jgi:excisionase family DNA binding protein
MTEPLTSTFTGYIKITPLLLSSLQAAALLGISRSHFYGLISSGTLGVMPIRLGERVLWNRNELERYVEAGCPTKEKWQAMKKGDNAGK